jgi:putative transposase
MNEPKRLYQNKYRDGTFRLKNWDYNSNGWYFITICTQDRWNWFGQTQKHRMNLSKIGEIIKKYWQDIPKHFEGIQLDEWIIMPNHIHGIIKIDRDQQTDLNNNDEIRRFVAMQRTYNIRNQTKKSESIQRIIMSKISPKKGSISTIIRSFKSICSKEIHKFEAEFAWQRRFHDRVIRNEQELFRIRHYIRSNPSKWYRDRNNLDN